MTASPSRRTVLGAAAAGGAALAASTLPGTSALAASGPTTSRLLVHGPGLRLLRRATYGPTPAMVDHIRHVGREKWLDEQLHPGRLDDGTVDKMLTHFPRLSWSVREVWDADQRTGVLHVDNYGWDVMQDLLLSTIGRALWSKRQLLELMVDFWSNHVNVTCPNGDVWDSRHLYDRQVIRKYALGKYRHLLLASAKHPSMLVYLNQAESNRFAPNENYARELLELHTVGVDGGYDEDDVQAAARLLTGLTLRNSKPTSAQPSWTRQTFSFDPAIHDGSSGKVLGHSWKKHAAGDGLTYINSYVTYLARHRQTAERIAYKLCQRFVGDSPPTKLVNRLADIYQRNDTDIRPVLHALFTSDAFYDDDRVKVRRPYEDVIAGLRAIGVRPSTNKDYPSTGSSYYEGLQAVYWQVYELGDAPFNWGQPNGYPDTARDWQSANGMLGRWNLHRNHVYGWWPSAGNKAFTWPAKPTVKKQDGSGKWAPADLPLCRALLPAKLPKTYGKLIDTLSERLLHQPMLHKHREAVAVYFGKTSSSPLYDTDAAVRWLFGDLVSLILDSPYHALR